MSLYLFRYLMSANCKCHRASYFQPQCAVLSKGISTLSSIITHIVFIHICTRAWVPWFLERRVLCDRLVDVDPAPGGPRPGGGGLKRSANHRSYGDGSRPRRGCGGIFSGIEDISEIVDLAVCV
jgi:hypothetical protein